MTFYQRFEPKVPILTKRAASVFLLLFFFFLFSSPSYAVVDTTGYPQNGRVNSSGTVPLKIRKESTTNCSIIGTIPRGSSITVLGKDGDDWYLVSYNGIKGYSYASYITLSGKQEEASTITSSYPQNGRVSQGTVPLKIREQPTTQSSIKGTIPRGSAITVLEQARRGWYKVIYKGITGYSSADYITLTDKTETIEKTSEPIKEKPENSESNLGQGRVSNGTIPLRIREKPTTNSAIKGTIPRGSVITVRAKANASWYEVSYNGLIGYSHASYITLINDENTDTKPTTPNISTEVAFPSQILEGIPNYNQNDIKWKYIYLGNSRSTIGTSGCVVTCLAEAKGYLTQTTITPDTIVNLSSFIDGAIIWPAGCYSYYGADYLSQIYKELKTGHPVLVGSKTASGRQHWVLVTGFTGGNSLDTSNFLINDPSGRYDTLQEYLGYYTNFYKIVKVR